MYTVPAYVDGAEPLQHVSVVAGKTVVLRCAVQGIPPPNNITWLKNGRAVRQDGRTRLLMSGRHLELSSAQESDAAWYSCAAGNVAGSARIEFNLTVVGIAFRHVPLIYCIVYSVNTALCDF